jgi:pyrroline-5-carboxylate reductase
MAFRIIKVTPNFARMMSTSATKVGFIGLGQMGNRMATNLMSKVKNQYNIYYCTYATTAKILVKKFLCNRSKNP